MKKLSIFLASVFALLSFASCEDDKEPVYTPAASDSFELLQPALQNQYYELTPDGTFGIDCKSMPDYGGGHPVGPCIFGALVSLTPDLQEEVVDLLGNVVTPANYIAIKASDTGSRMIFSDSSLAEAICLLKGLTKNDAGYTFSDTEVVYFRATCRIDGIEGSDVVSKNYVSLNRVMPYFAIPSPGFIYLVGQPEGWAGPSEANADHYNDWKLFEKDDAIGSKVYYGTFDIGAGEQATFRFYTALTGWDNDSYGSQSDDNPIDYELDANGGFEGKVVKGKGSFRFSSWPGGMMAIKVDMSDMNNIRLQVSPAEE